MADETTTPLNQGLGKWLQVTTGGVIETWDGTQKSSSIRGLSGVTMADMWRLTTNFTGSANPITTNLERADSDGFGLLGTGMSEASGIFTFPSTGYYHISFNVQWIYSGDVSTLTNRIQTTVDGSTYDDAAIAQGHITQVSTESTRISQHSQFVFSVTDTATHKAQFGVTVSDASASTIGNTDLNYTYMTFIRLGDV